LRKFPEKLLSFGSGFLGVFSYPENNFQDSVNLGRSPIAIISYLRYNIEETRGNETLTRSETMNEKLKARIEARKASGLSAEEYNRREENRAQREVEARHRAVQEDFARTIQSGGRKVKTCFDRNGNLWIV
jgi:hypothetical protein